MTPTESIRNQLERIREALSTIEDEVDTLDAPPPAPVEPPLEEPPPDEPDARDMLDALALRHSAESGDRLIGMSAAILPHVVVGAAHAPILPGSEIHLRSGERAVVLARTPIIPPGWEGKEAIAAVLDREIAGWCPLYVHEGMVSFAEGASFASVPIRATYAGIANGGSLDAPRISEVAGTLRISRLDGRRDAATYHASDPALEYGQFSGAFEGEQGMSGGPCYVGDRIASVHWYPGIDDWIGCRQVRDHIEAHTPPVVHGWTTSHDGDYLSAAAEGGVLFHKHTRHGHALTYPSGANAGRRGRALTFWCAVTEGTRILQRVQVKDADGRRTKRTLALEWHSTAPRATVLGREATTVRLSLGSGPTAEATLDVEALFPDVELLQLLDLRLTTTGEIRGARLVA